MRWTFSGDAEGVVVGRVIDASGGWDMSAFISWTSRKNFVVAVYDPKEDAFVLASHILLEGRVVIQNLARLVSHFDLYIRDFLSVMNIDERRLRPLE